MLRFLTCFLAVSLVFVSAKSRHARQVDETLTDSEGSGLQFINFDEGSASNPIVARDPEGSGLMYDEEGSGNTLLFDSETPIQVTNVTGTQAVPDAAPAESNVFNQSINITDADVETLVIKVHLPQKTTSQLLDDLKDDTAQQNPISTLDTAVSLTSVLNELLGRIQDATN